MCSPVVWPRKKKTLYNLLRSLIFFTLLLGKFSLFKKNVLRIIQINWKHMENARMVNTQLLLANMGFFWCVFVVICGGRSVGFLSQNRNAFLEEIMPIL